MGLPNNFIADLIGFIHDFIAGYWPLVLLIIGIFLGFFLIEFLLDLFCDWVEAHRKIEASAADYSSIIVSLEKKIELEQFEDLLRKSSLGIAITARARARAQEAISKLTKQYQN